MRRRRWIGSPSLSRLSWYARQISQNIDKRLFLGVIPLVLFLDGIGALLITILEKPITLNAFGESLNWALLTTMGRSERLL